MNPAWTLRTGRLLLTPIGGQDLADFRAIAGDPRVFAVMLGGVRDPVRAADDLARFVIAWGRCGYGIWAIREPDNRHRFLGIVGLEDRPDGRGTGLRFALWPEAQGRGLAREAAWAALRFGHDQAGLRRIVAVARETNVGSRTVLGCIGMHEAETFTQNGYCMVLYESVSGPAVRTVPGVP
ncbi:GNAT family N-acetyltransferase [Rhodopila sp.]|jgi:RimJ/RimL family protein N-acetyltransferase|uniref:GNAT family N-acetyltransferase n=1 Tax=Rhodopila sp. TaxID=2480087 RepID=UPI002CD9D739|nr:GNAT family N-acetyltransferase [Rhodopila sp.]HVZ10264.1 GNAT family N-acetyltransferase [Rhodopila sp.]